MKTDKNILIAFILNISFSILEIIGGFLTNSVAIISDAVHDCGDAISIGLSYFLERKSKKVPDDKYTYGYIRYSVLGALTTTIILFIGSTIVIYNSILRILNPVEVNYDGMLVISIIGVTFNFIAAYITKSGDSLNQKSVNLHMLEDVFGWIVILIGSILMKFTKIVYVDSIMSIIVSIYILIHTLKNLKSIIDLFLEKTPNGISIIKLKNNLLNIHGILDVHHIHVWSIDSVNNYATMHVLYNGKNGKQIKQSIRKNLAEFQIIHTTIELETEEEKCIDTSCNVIHIKKDHHH